MINAVTTPTTPVSPSANAGSGAISPTFCREAKQRQSRTHASIFLPSNRERELARELLNLKHPFAGGELHADRPEEGEHGAAAEPHVQPRAALGSLLAPDAQGLGSHAPAH